MKLSQPALYTVYTTSTIKLFIIMVGTKFN